MNEIQIEALTCRYGSALAVDGIDLDVKKGEFLAVLGPSGCGKTTTLRCIAGLERPAAGRISIGGVLVADGGRGYSVVPNKRGLGMVFQSYALWPHMNVFDNVAYPLRRHGCPASELGAKVNRALSLVGLHELAHRGVSELSGGQQQRAALARALAAEPQVLLLDEPLSNLDAALRSQTRQELRRIHREVRATCVYVTHDQLEAATLADRLVVMRAGRIEQVGTPRQIFDGPENTWVAEFLGYDNFVVADVVGQEGELVRTRPRGWPTDLLCTSSTVLPAGRPITLTFRSSSLVTQQPALNASIVQARLIDSVFTGDLTELVVDAYGTRLVARVSERSSRGRPQSDRMPGSTIELAVPSEHIVVLPAAA